MFFFVATAGGQKRLEARPGDTLGRALFRVGYYVGAPLCAGLGRCGRCRVRFLTDAPEPVPAELRRLGAGDIDAGWRLACLHPVRGGELLEVTDPGTSPAYDKTGAVRPVEVPGPLGLAVDLGTTGLAWRLVGLEDGRIVAEGRGVNPQLGAGGEVVSRLAFAEEAGGGRYLRELVLAELASKAALAGRPLAACCVAGNSVMVSILCDKPLGGLARAPYGLEWSAGETCDLGHGLPPIYIPPLLGPFVGADISAGLIALLGREPRYPFLLADFGTNAEMVLGLAPDRFLAASAPLGPALEGVGLSHGALAGPGVAVSFDLTPSGLAPVLFEGSGGASTPRGIAGPGYLALAARLVEHKILDVAGHFAQTPAPTPLGERMRRQVVQEGGEAVFVTHGLRFFASDVEELLKVKAACNMAVATLLAAAGLGTAQLAAVHLAGAFGSHVAPEDLETLGFFPPGLASRMRTVGNVSLEGATLFLTNFKSRGVAAALPSQTGIVPLVAGGEAADAFIRRMVFAYVP